MPSTQADKRTTLINIVLFQIGWWTAVLLHSPIVLWVTVIILIAHALWVTKSIREWLTIGIISVIGITIDSVLMHAGILEFNSPPETRILCPSWLIGLWLVFSTTVGFSFQYFANKRLLASIAGALGGSTSYYAGEHFGALNLGEPKIQSIVILVILWAALLPIFLAIHQYITRIKIEPTNT